MKKTGMALAGAALAVGLVSATAGTAQAATYTRTQVAQHASTSDCWTIIGRNVYNLTPYVPMHPGGPQEIGRVCGKVGTSAFMGEHGGNSSIQRMLKAYRVGALKR